MRSPRRLLLLLVPLVVGLAAASLPSRAQQANSRYAFADTTLLRDTLGLSFEALFPLADSLGLLPDTLRAISIRYTFRLERLIELADSLGVPVDSVGPVLERERFNPLAAARGQHLSTFRYSTGYNIGQTNSTWSNGGDYNLVRDQLFLRNTTNITMDRYQTGGRTRLRQTRSANTEAGWKLSSDFSVGARANLDRFDNLDPGSTNNEKEAKNEFQASLRSRQQPARGLSSELNFFSGLLDLRNSAQVKRGLSGDLNGRVRYARGNWLTHDLSGGLTGNLSRTRRPTDVTDLSTQDLSKNLRGTLGLFPLSPVGLNASYTLRRVRVESPLDSGRIQQFNTNNNGADVSMRLRQDNDRYLNLTQRYSTSRQASSGGAGSNNNRRDIGFTSDGRYRLLGWNLEGRFSSTYSRSEFPPRASSGGYGESLRVRSLDASLQRVLTRTLTAKASGSISLSAYRYFTLGGNPPVPRDQYRQSYRIEVGYSPGQQLNSSVAIDVSRSLFINIPSTSSASNNEVRTYRGSWSWTYRLLSGLTASQSNQVNADYTFYTFVGDNNRLSLDYTTRTTLNAVITPRLSVDVAHSARYQPSGSYLVQDDGLDAFGRADENENFGLTATIAYRPSPAISFSLQPDYQASNRSGSVNGALVPQRRSRSLNMSGGVSLNLPIGSRARLSGDMRRTFRADRSTTYTSGQPQPSPVSQIDYWNGSLQLSWDL